MKIAVIGNGNVGGTLGRKWRTLGHTVRYGRRRGAAEMPEDHSPVGEAIGFGSVVLLATPWAAAEEVARSFPNWGDRILLDCTNPLESEGPAVGVGGSGAERVAAAAPEARVIKIFNTAGAKVMENPDFGGRAAAMLYCGDDDGAKAVAARLAAEIGFEPVDAGPLRQAGTLEALGMLRESVAMRQGYGREMALRLLRR